MRICVGRGSSPVPRKIWLPASKWRRFTQYLSTGAREEGSRRHLFIYTKKAKYRYIYKKIKFFCIYVSAWHHYFLKPIGCFPNSAGLHGRKRESDASHGLQGQHRQEQPRQVRRQVDNRSPHRGGVMTVPPVHCSLSFPMPLIPRKGPRFLALLEFRFVLANPPLSFPLRTVCLTIQKIKECFWEKVSVDFMCLPHSPATMEQMFC